MKRKFAWFILLSFLILPFVPLKLLYDGQSFLSLFSVGCIVYAFLFLFLKERFRYLVESGFFVFAVIVTLVSNDAVIAFWAMNFIFGNFVWMSWEYSQLLTKTRTKRELSFTEKIKSITSALKESEHKG
ncbi:hypothetical protein [Brevibacillus laterosporus]|uniref:hypothetical protein n=1 Tax=Brevibacillus laterosporus TaxID=1465 RepID=UPI003D24483C